MILLNLQCLKERKMNIESIYHSYLVSVEDARDYYKTKNVLHASGAGSCYRKQLYSYFDYPRDSKDSRSYRLLRLGTIVHKDIEEALKNYEDMPIDRESDVFSEDEIKLPDFNVIGTYDVGELKDGEFTLWDIKTAAAYKWSKKFGRTPDKSSDINYKLQLGTYALGVNQKYQVDKINMYILWYNKNTSQMREQLISPEWIEKALEYWAELNNILDDCGKKFEEDLKPEYWEGVPFQNWECKYCQYYSICPSKLAE